MGDIPPVLARHINERYTRNEFMSIIVHELHRALNETGMLEFAMIDFCHGPVIQTYIEHMHETGMRIDDYAIEVEEAVDEFLAGQEEATEHLRNLYVNVIKDKIDDYMFHLENETEQAHNINVT